MSKSERIWAALIAGLETQYNIQIDYELIKAGDNNKKVKTKEINKG